MSKTKLLITDGLAPEGVKILEDSGIFEISLNKGLEKDALIKMLPDYEAIIIRSATKLKDDVLAAGTGLKAIMRAGSGVDNIDVPKASEMGVLVFNTPGANNNAVVELTLGFMFCLVRELPRADAGTKAGKWEKKALVGGELQGKTLGVLGLGAIGGSVAQKARALGMKVLGYDPNAGVLKLDGKVDKICDSVDEIFAGADIVTLHMPLLDSTKESIGAAQFSKMRKGSYFVNCSRGGIVNEKDLLGALNEGILAGAAMDVFATEPVDANDELIKHPAFICAPHIGASTKEAQLNVALKAANSLVAYFKDGDTTDALNKGALN